MSPPSLRGGAPVFVREAVLHLCRAVTSLFPPRLLYTRATLKNNERPFHKLDTIAHACRNSYCNRP
jgi:hypothetical protein